MKPKSARVWKLDIQNATNRLIEYLRYFNFDIKQIEVAAQTVIILSLSYWILILNAFERIHHWHFFPIHFMHVTTFFPRL